MPCDATAGSGLDMVAGSGTMKRWKVIEATFPL